MKDGAKADTVTTGTPGPSGPIIPGPAVPDKVIESNRTSVAEVKKPAPLKDRELIEKKVPKYKDEKPSGTITLFVYKNKPYVAKFTGWINGFEMNIAIPAIRKHYKLWKRGLINKGGK